MEKRIVPVEFTFEQRILHHLMLNAHFLKDVGLVSGKMGIVLALAEYQQSVRNPVYEDFTDELMEEVLSGIHNELPIGFSSGLCGIGWGIEYLLQNGFMEGESVGICEDIDKKIMEKDPGRIEDMSLETGLEGILRYVLAHLQGALRQKSALPFDEAYREGLFGALQKLRKSPLSENMVRLVGEYERFYTAHKEPEIALSLDDLAGECHVEGDHLEHCPLGLGEGLAGMLLKRKTNNLPV